MMETPAKTLILGSGPIKIAEAAEFDYSGSQALKALKEEGIETVVINPNIATIQTDRAFADRVYLLPLTSEFVERVIERERPDSILLGFGGQTALSLGVSLYRSGVLDRYSVRVLGTPISGIEAALDRELFKSLMNRSGVPVPPSASARDPSAAVEAAESIGYPVIVRVSFNLGGRGSFVAWSRRDLEEGINRAIAHSGIGSVLVEKYLDGWKEIEFEIVRDSRGNSIAVACLENVDPLGIHTGDSVVVAPCQTLDNTDYYNLRDASIAVADKIGLIGECNVQLALNPRSRDFYVIETNPRMSRSSALASKATGYPLAYIAAKLALGYSLDELLNTITGATCACFEPSLDYVVVKIPRWDLDKFEGVDRSVGSEMKSVGEVMAIGRNIYEAFQKAVRMLDLGLEGLDASYLNDHDLETIIGRLKSREPYWFIYVYRAIKLGADLDELSRITGIDKFYLYILKEIADAERSARDSLDGSGYRSIGPDIDAVEIPRDYLSALKSYGFSNSQLANLLGVEDQRIRLLINRYGLKPYIKRIDTLAAEKPARTNYLYLTYDGVDSDIDTRGIADKHRNRILIIGAGVFRIGVSVEFDWATVNLARELRSRGLKVSIVNYNPETVSTDWDESDNLYFEEVSLESIENIYRYEKPRGVIVSVGGQLSNSLAKELEEHNIPIIGVPGKTIDIAEDRSKFSRLVEELGLRQPEYVEATDLGEVISFIDEVGFPVIVRPSYVLSGTSMKIAYDLGELLSYISKATKVSKKYPVVISKFIEDAIEVEVDAVSDSRRIVGVTIEHIEPSGVHSGDSTMVTPVRRLRRSMLSDVWRCVSSIAMELGIRGPFNIQFLVKDGATYVLELNLRASRSMPFSSKSRGVNLIRLFADVVDKGYIDLDLGGYEGSFYELPPRSWAVKSPQFSWAQLKGAYPYLGPEMRSTGEAACLGNTYYDALLKSWLAVSPNRVPPNGSIILVYGRGGVDRNLLTEASTFLKEAGYRVASIAGLEVDGVDLVLDLEDAVDYIRRGKVGLVATSGYMPDLDYSIRRTAVDLNIPIILNSMLALELSRSLKWRVDGGIFSVDELSSYW